MSKAGSPHHAHSASRNTGPVGADQDVLRADVAVHQRHALRARDVDEMLEPRRQVGMPPRGGQQVGLEADVEEDRVGVELGREFRTRAPSRRGCVRAPCRPPARSPRRRGRRAAAASTGAYSEAAGSPSPARRAPDAGPARAARSPACASLATRIQRASYRLRSIGARQSAATRSFASARLAHTGPCAAVDAPDVGRHAAGQRRAGDRARARRVPVRAGPARTRRAPRLQSPRS